MSPFNNICAGKILTIPANQRAFSWGSAQVDDLISDLKLAGTQAHYLGTVIVSRAKNVQDFQDDDLATTAEFILEDGQQRITTLMIFANELRKEMQVRRVHLLQADKLEDFVFYKKGGKFSRIKNEQQNLHQYFNYILTGQPAPPASRVGAMKALDEVKRHLQNFVKSLQDGELLSWTQSLSNRALLVWVDLEASGTNLNRYLTFDAINSRGLPLSEFDKIKNFCILIGSLRGSPVDVDISHHWFNALLELEKYGTNTRTHEQDFIAEIYSCCHNKLVGHSEVHDAFVERYRPLLSQDDQALLTDLLYFVSLWQPYARSFGFLTSKNRGAHYGSECTPIAGKWLDRLDNMGLPTITRPILVVSHFRLPKHEFEQVARLCEIYTFRVHAVLRRRKDNNSQKMVATGNELLRGNLTLKKLERRFGNWLSAQGHLTAVLKELIDGKPKYFFDPTMPGWSSCYYFLYEYELHISPNGVQPLPYETNRDVSKNQQEHILPQTHRDGGWWQQHWPDEALANKYKHRLGNLVLTTNNQALSRRSIMEKMSRPSPEYSFSHINATNSEKRIVKFTNGTEWTAKNILTREMELLDFAAKRWSLSNPNCDSGLVDLPEEFRLVRRSTFQLPELLPVQPEAEENDISEDDLSDPD
jgi:hypothetical protein